MSIQRKTPLKLCGGLALAGLGTPNFWPVTVDAVQVGFAVASGADGSAIQNQADGGGERFESELVLPSCEKLDDILQPNFKDEKPGESHLRSACKKLDKLPLLNFLMEESRLLPISIFAAVFASAMIQPKGSKELAVVLASTSAIAIALVAGGRRFKRGSELPDYDEKNFVIEAFTAFSSTYAPFVWSEKEVKGESIKPNPLKPYRIARALDSQDSISKLKLTEAEIYEYSSDLMITANDPGGLQTVLRKRISVDEISRFENHFGSYLREVYDERKFVCTPLVGICKNVTGKSSIFDGDDSRPSNDHGEYLDVEADKRRMNLFLDYQLQLEVLNSGFTSESSISTRQALEILQSLAEEGEAEDPKDDRLTPVAEEILANYGGKLMSSDFFDTFNLENFLKETRRQIHELLLDISNSEITRSPAEPTGSQKFTFQPNTFPPDLLEFAAGGMAKEEVLATSQWGLKQHIKQLSSQEFCESDNDYVALAEKVYKVKLLWRMRSLFFSVPVARDCGPGKPTELQVERRINLAQYEVVACLRSKFPGVSVMPGVCVCPDVPYLKNGWTPGRGHECVPLDAENVQLWMTEFDTDIDFDNCEHHSKNGTLKLNGESLKIFETLSRAVSTTAYFQHLIRDEAGDMWKVTLRSESDDAYYYPDSVLKMPCWQALERAHQCLPPSTNYSSGEMTWRDYGAMIQWPAGMALRTGSDEYGLKQDPFAGPGIKTNLMAEAFVDLLVRHEGKVLLCGHSEGAIRALFCFREVVDYVDAIQECPSSDWRLALTSLSQMRKQRGLNANLMKYVPGAKLHESDDSHEYSISMIQRALFERHNKSQPIFRPEWIKHLRALMSGHAANTIDRDWSAWLCEKSDQIILLRSGVRGGSEAIQQACGYTNNEWQLLCESKDKAVRALTQAPILLDLYGNFGGQEIPHALKKRLRQLEWILEGSILNGGSELTGDLRKGSALGFLETSILEADKPRHAQHVMAVRRNLPKSLLIQLSSSIKSKPYGAPASARNVDLEVDFCNSKRIHQLKVYKDICRAIPNDKRGKA